MKKTLIATLFCLAALAISAPSWSYKLHPMQKRNHDIGKTPLIQLVKDGVPQFEVLVPQNASPTAAYAGNELTYLLEKCLGTKIAAVKAPSGKLPAIIIGDKELAKAAGLDLSKLDRDGFYIKTFNGNVLIIGNDDPKQRPTYGGRDAGEHATLFATYEFLERFAGIRFYFPGELGTITPKLRDWSIPSIDISDRPDFPERFLYITYAPTKKYKDIFRPQEYGNNKVKDMLRYRHETWNWVCSHGLGKLGYPQRFGKEHPEYFAETFDGKTTLGTRKELAYCYSRGFKDEVIKDTLSFLKGEKADVRGVRPYTAPEKIGWPHELNLKVPVFDITPDDSYLSCKCPVCRKIYIDENGNEDRRKLSDFMWNFYADVANAVKKAGVNGYVAAWSYNPTLTEPPMELPDNVLLVVCARGPWSYKNKKAWQDEHERIAKFGKLSHSNIRLWNYWIKFPFGSMLDVPVMAPHAVAAYYKKVAPYICGAFAETEIERQAYHYLNHYIFYKLMWNIDTDVDALLEEHYKLLYGNAAATMKEIFNLFEDAWLTATGNFVDTPEGPKTVIPSDYDMWTKYYPAELIEKVNSLFKTAESQVAPDSQELTRIRLMYREQWLPTVEVRSEWEKNSDMSNCWNGFAAEGTPQTIDGIPDEKEWNAAPTMWLAATAQSIFNQHRNEVENKVKVLFDKDNYYIAFDCDEPDTDKLMAASHKAGSNSYWHNATLQVFMDTQNERKGFYQVAVDKNGAVATLRWKNGVTVPWKNSVRVVNHFEPGKKWQAEFVIPRNEIDGDAKVFPANFMRYRAMTEGKPEVYYWFPFLGRTPLAPDKWGYLHLGKEENPSLVQLGDFEKPVAKNGRLGKWWGDILRDDKEYLTGGGSIRLEKGHASIAQSLPLKPDTEYEVSFFAKLEKLGDNTAQGGLRVRIDEYKGKNFIFPTSWRAFFRGTHDWQRFRYYIKTGNDPNAKRIDHISFRLIPDTIDGNAWIDHVEIREVKQDK